MTTTIAAPTTDRPLRVSLRLDSLMCAVFVPVLLVGAGLFGDLLGLPGALLIGAALVLAPFAAFLWWVSATPVIRPSAVSVAVAGNALWVLASLAVLALLTPTTLGFAFVLVQAAAVAGITVVEAVALRRIIGGSAPKETR